MSELHIDFETRSIVDLRKSGVYRYGDDPSTSVLCMAYAFGDDDPLVWLPWEKDLPKRIVKHIEDGGTIYAHNAQFERVIWSKVMKHWPRVPFEQWRCTAAMAACLALPRDLARAAMAVGLSQNKDDAGRRIMLKLCAPRAVLPDGKIVWWEDKEDLSKLYAYCAQDVRVERALMAHLRPLSDSEQKVWSLDQKINERGVFVDRVGVNNARVIVTAALAEVNLKASQITDGYVSSITQAEAIKDFARLHGTKIESIDKTALADVLKDESIDPKVRELMLLRQEGAKSSTAKLRAYQERVSADGRMRDNLMYYGANTGRWSGRGAQLQNLPRSQIKDIPEAIEDMKFRDPKRLSIFYGPPLSVVSDCLRGFVVAPRGKKLVCADFSNIEGRVLAWLSGHDVLVEKFARNEKIYEEMAAAIYGVPASTVKKGSKERHLGKEAVLGGGYGMGHERFQWQCAKGGLTIDDDLAERTIQVYRAKNEPIVLYWRALEDAAMAAITKPGTRFIVAGTKGTPREVSYAVHGGILWCRLPSGRFLTYPDPRIMPVMTPWGEEKESITYMTIDGLTNQWSRDKTYGGKLAENVTSGAARDIMAEAMLRLEEKKYFIVLTVHDEIVCEVDEGFGSFVEMERIMCQQPTWCPGLPIAAEGWEGARYRK